MRLGIMLRHFDQHDGGVKVYTRELLRAMISLNTKHEIVLLFRSRQLGTYAESAQGVSVREVLLEGGPILAWDQLKVPDAVKKYGDGDGAKAASHPEVQAALKQAVDGLNATMASFESIKRFTVLPEDFTEANGQLTPSLKVKRKVAVERQRPVLDSLYGGGAAAAE